MTTITAIVPEEITEVKVDSYKDDKFIETLVLDKDSNFTCMYPDDDYTIDPKPLDGYEITTEGTTVTYLKKIVNENQDLIDTLRKALEVLENQ